MLNGFPRRFSCLALKEKPRRPIKSFQSFTCLPYIHSTTDKIQRVFNDVGVKVAMRPFVTIGKSLPSPKDSLDVNEITGIIYQFTKFRVMIVPLFTSAKLNETCNRAFPNIRERSSINNQKSLLFVSTPSPWTI